ncbi:MAG: ABC transporter substrate-binding protein [Gammaproteobacteria bacterium]
MKSNIITFLLMLFCSSLVYAEKLSVILDWFPNPDHAPLIIAKQQGYFKEQGLDVDIIGPADPHDPPKLVATGKVDIGISYEPHLIEFVDQGLPLIRFGTLIDQPLDCMIALKQSQIKTISDLKGKKIGVGSNSMGNILLNVVLAKAGIKPSEIELVTINYNLTQALLSRQVDVITDVMRNVEILQLTSAGQQLVTFYPEQYGVPTYNVLIFITNTTKKEDPRLPKFLAAIKKATLYLKAHPEAAWLAFAKDYPEANNPVNRQSWFVTIPYFAKDPAYFNPQEWQDFAKFMQKNGLIKTVQPVDRYAFVPR